MARLRRDPIKHVVVLMFENHSFDQMLGCYNSVYSGLEGVDSRNVNFDSGGRPYPQSETHDLVVSPDPMHELANVRNQLASGFVLDYESAYPGTSSADRARIMGYYPRGVLPVTHGLADNFMICDHWFSSVPGPTWTNRFFVHSGTSNGFVSMPEGIGDLGHFLRYDQDTIFDRLTERRIKWRVYFGDVPQSLVLRDQRRPSNARNYRLMHSFWDDTRSARSFPAYSFIEPSYFYGEQNDDHPPNSSVRAQRLLARVYNALRANEELWKSTLLVVLYDEHGGFYDHVTPPAAVPPDGRTDEYTFDRLGVRVPALLISPWIAKGFANTVFDHTSLLRYLLDKWNLEPLTERVSAANSFADLISAYRSDTPVSMPVPQIVASMAMEARPAGAAEDITSEELDEPLNDYQRSLFAFSEYLDSEQPRTTRAMMTAGPLAETVVARRRVASFLEERGARL
jgi:phospholipase C